MALPELFANSSTPGSVVALTTLGASQGSTSSLTFTMNAAAPASLQATGAGQFRAVIDSEIIIFDATQCSTTSWTAISRGAEGSTAATHASGASVFHYLTAGGLASGYGAPMWRPRSGVYLVTPGAQVAGSGSPGLNICVFTPFPVPMPFTTVALGLSVTVAVATAVIRLGVYLDDGTMTPSKLLVDGGTIDASTTGYKEVTVSTPLPAGIVWLVAVQQIAAASYEASNNVVPVPAPSGNAAQNKLTGYAGGSVTGALPSTAPAIQYYQVGSGNGAAPHILIKAA